MRTNYTQLVQTKEFSWDLTAAEHTLMQQADEVVRQVEASEREDKSKIGSGRKGRKKTEKEVDTLLYELKGGKVRRAAGGALRGWLEENVISVILVLTVLTVAGIIGTD